MLERGSACTKEGKSQLALTGNMCLCCNISRRTGSTRESPPYCYLLKGPINDGRALCKQGLGLSDQQVPGLQQQHQQQSLHEQNCLTAMMRQAQSVGLWGGSEGLQSAKDLGRNPELGAGLVEQPHGNTGFQGTGLAFVCRNPRGRLGIASRNLSLDELSGDAHTILPILCITAELTLLLDSL